MMQCPECGSTTFCVYRTITIEQHCHVHFRAPGDLIIVMDELRDTVDTGPVEDIQCADCDSTMDLPTFGYPGDPHDQTTE